MKVEVFSSIHCTESNTFTESKSGNPYNLETFLNNLGYSVLTEVMTVVVSQLSRPPGPTGGKSRAEHKGPMKCRAMVHQSLAAKKQ